MDLTLLTHPELHRLRADALVAGDRATAESIASLLAERERQYHRGEVLDTYDDSQRWTGTKDRGLVHLDGDWHRSFHCWVVSPLRRTLLVQRRSHEKEAYPGALDATVAGHYRAGETVREACRETDEELGLTVDAERLVALGRAMDTSRHGILIDREVADVFLYATDLPLQALRPDPAEVAEVLEVEVAAALALFTGEVQGAPATVRGGGTCTIRADEFTPHLDRYYPRLALQAARLVDGLQPLCI